MSNNRPGFYQHITSALKHGDGVKAFGFWFRDPTRLAPADVDSTQERYAFLIRKGMGPLEVAAALEKVAHQMRTRTGSNGDERLEGREVNAADFPLGQEAASEQPIYESSQAGELGQRGFRSARYESLMASKQTAT